MATCLPTVPETNQGMIRQEVNFARLVGLLGFLTEHRGGVPQRDVFLPSHKIHSILLPSRDDDFPTVAWTEPQPSIPQSSPACKRWSLPRPCSVKSDVQLTDGREQLETQVRVQRPSPPLHERAGTVNKPSWNYSSEGSHSCSPRWQLLVSEVSHF